jgi:hypothetical protein
MTFFKGHIQGTEERRIGEEDICMHEVCGRSGGRSGGTQTRPKLHLVTLLSVVLPEYKQE